MLVTSLLYHLAFSAFGSSRANSTIGQHKKEEPPASFLPRFDPTSFTEAHHLAKLNLLRQKEILEEEPESRDEAFLHRMEKRIGESTDQELHALVSSQENDTRVRRMGAAELVNRKDGTAGLTFLFCIIDDNDDPIFRKICAIGLGEIGNRVFLEVLQNIKEDDLIYKDAQEAITKIRTHETAIMNKKRFSF